jgi:HEAT repeats
MEREVGLLQRAVELGRAAASEQDYDAVWMLLEKVAQNGLASVPLGTAMLDAADPVERAVGCDLLGLIAENLPAERAGIANALLSLGETEQSEEVYWSLARAVGATAESRAVTLLTRLAGHSDADVRLQVALSLPKIWSQDVRAPEVLVLTGLTADTDPDVRNWATFGLGTQLAKVDSPVVRAALWNRAEDDNPDVREEGICGLARRRDRRAAGLLAGLLAAEDGVHDLVFGAAAVLGAPDLLPLLQQFDRPDDVFIRDALTECDPAARSRRDQLAWDLLGRLYQDRPSIDAWLVSCRYEAGIDLCVNVDGKVLTWSVDRLVVRAGGDPHQAATLVSADLS